MASTMDEESRKRIAELEAQVEQQNSQLADTTLREMLKACHENFQERFTVQFNKELATKGSITKPIGRKHPSFMQRWHQFDNLQAQAFHSIREKIDPTDHEPNRIFPPVAHIRRSGKSQEGKKIASEQDLRDFQSKYVNDFVLEICRAFGSTVSVHNYLQPIQPDHNNDSVQEAYQPSKPTYSSPGPSRPVNADLFFVFDGEDIDSRLVVAGELKPPHKVTARQCEDILGRGETIDVKKLRQQLTVPTDTEGHYLYQARRMVAIAATQTYDYMLDGGCTYGCILTGEVLIFLKIDDEEPSTLHYHLAYPAKEVKSDGDQTFRHSKTAIALLASFCQIAMQSQPHDQDWIRDAKSRVERWIVEDEPPPKETPKKERERNDRHERKDASYHGSDDDDDESDSDDRKKPKKRTHDRRESKAKGNQDRRQDSDEEGPPGRQITLSQRLGASNVLSSPKQGKSPSYKTTSTGKQQQRPYCTQACLLGLVEGSAIDECCPNVDFHPRGTLETRHSITRASFSDLMQAQLFENMDRDCQNLRIQGARGMLFKLTLTSHGYTFVAKATIKCFVAHVKHEGRVYQLLHDLQGKQIPVYLGNIDLAIPWYGPGVHLVHMLLLSYGGETLDWQEILDHWQEVLEFQDALAARGIRHGDLDELRNVLWNAELGRCMFIDFERSVIKGLKKIHAIDSVPQQGRSAEPAATCSGKRKALEVIDPLPTVNKKVAGDRLSAVAVE